MNTEKKVWVKRIKRIVLLTLPYVLTLCALMLISFGGLRVIADIPVVSAFLNPKITTSEPVSSAPIVEKDDETFPSIAFESQWATLSVEGWTKNKSVPVYFGDSNEILHKGAGLWIGSRFCGQNGKIVVSAHVTTDFYELEDTPVGATVTMNTVYGDYTYKVREKKVFSASEQEIVYPEDGKEVLFMYTCYPRSVGVGYTSQRCALICDKVSGKEWSGYGQ